MVTLMVTVPKVELVHTDQFLFLFWVIYPHLALRGEKTNKNSGQSYREAWGGGLLEPQSARPRDTKDTPCVPNMGWQWGSTQRGKSKNTHRIHVYFKEHVYLKGCTLSFCWHVWILSTSECTRDRSSGHSGLCGRPREGRG